jgi:hypothetical protein
MSLALLLGLQQSDMYQLPNSVGTGDGQ